MVLISINCCFLWKQLMLRKLCHGIGWMYTYSFLEFHQSYIYIFFKLNLILFYSRTLISGNSFIWWDHVALDCWLLCAVWIGRGCSHLALFSDMKWALKINQPCGMCIPDIICCLVLTVNRSFLFFSLSPLIICLTFILDLQIITQPEYWRNCLWNNVHCVCKIPVGRVSTWLSQLMQGGFSYPK